MGKLYVFMAELNGYGALLCVADLLVGILISQVLRLRGVADNVQVVCAALWFFNPFTFAVATRGNCEALVCVVILWILKCLMTGMFNSCKADYLIDFIRFGGHCVKPSVDLLVSPCCGVFVVRAAGSGRNLVWSGGSLPHLSSHIRPSHHLLS